MAADPLEVRIARLEGGYEQIGQRLSSLEAAFRTESASVRGEIAALRSEVHRDIHRLSGRVDFLMYGVIASILVPIFIRVFFGP